MNGITIFGKPAQIGASTHDGARDKRNDDRMAAFVGASNSGAPVQYLLVADGVTSTHGGDQASDIAMRRLQEALQKPSDKPLSDRLADAIQQANQAILNTAVEQPDLKGMSTTLVLAAIEGEKVCIMHLGDSRAYLLRGERAYQLTLDHTWIQEALDEGRVTPEQAASHPNRHVIQRYLGAPRGINIDQRIIEPGTEGSAAERKGLDALPLQPGDVLLLCSDGLYGRVSSAEIAAAVAQYRGQPQRAADALVQMALKRGEPDNITALLWATAGGAPAAAAGGRRKGAAIALAAALAALALAAVFLFSSRPSTTAGVETPAAVVAVAGDGSTAAPAETTAVVPEDSTTATNAVAVALPSTPSSTPVTTATARLEPTSTAALLAADSPGSDNLIDPIGATVQAGAAGIGEALETPTPQRSPAAAPTGTVATQGAPAGTPSVAQGAPAGQSTSTRPPTSTPAPTSTPSPTRTPPPTPTRTPTAAAAAAATQPSTNTPAPGGNLGSTNGGPRSVKILAPADKTATGAETIFAWEPDAPLAEGQLYEVAFWRPNDSQESAQAWRDATQNTQIQIFPDGRSGTYNWGVWLGRMGSTGKYERLKYLGGGYEFTISSESGGSDDSGEGSGSSDTGGK